MALWYAFRSRGLTKDIRIKGGPNGYTRTLGKALELVTTPTARDWKSEKASEQTHARNSRPLSETFGQNTGYRLQPGFVEWMQGYPPGWTHIEPDASSNSETP